MKKESQTNGPVLYWMSRDQRVSDNWALLYARELAEKFDTYLAVAFCIFPQLSSASGRQYLFMLRGLKEVENKLRALNIPFFLLQGDLARDISHLLGEIDARALVCDFSPLRQIRECKNMLAGMNKIPIYEVDAHNIIPCWFASPKQEWSARSFRPKVHRLLFEFLDEFPTLPEGVFNERAQTNPMRNDAIENDWQEAERGLRADAMPEAKWIVPGEAQAMKQLDHFLKIKLDDYERNRNDPNIDGQSGLSPYLHFGQISAQRVALQVLKSGKQAGAFLEELIVRRELSENYCYYNQHYDDTQGFPAWGIMSLHEHELDRREYLYTHSELEKALTHDDLWNAAQQQMLRTGKMHGYMRMYWAKKILEWTASPAVAQTTAIYLNDRYELDGRDPNGYAGIAWSLGGLHDRAWKERVIFGKVRYMNYNGAKSKFDVQAYIDKWTI